MINKKSKNDLLNWEKTNKYYVEWFARTPLRKFFSQNIKIDNFSLWWITYLCGKDNMVYNRWYYNLKGVLFDNKKIRFNKYSFYIIFILKLSSNFLKNFFWFFLIKFVSFSRYKKIRRKHCFHSYSYNFFKNGDFLFDRFYGKATYLKNLNDNFHIVSVIRRRQFFSNYLKKKYIPCVIADEFITFFNFFSVYFEVLICFFRVNNYLSKDKNFFRINRINCRKILEPLLLSSFSGEIQNSLLRAISIRNFLRKNKVKTFINYGEFIPGYRSIYFFVRSLKDAPIIASIQHSNANKNILYCVHKKDEFTNNKKLEGGFFSPTPDFYLTQGKQYDKVLKTFFPNKTKIIGSLRLDLIEFKKKNIRKEIYKIKYDKKKRDKKIILVCPSIGDEIDVLNFVKESYNPQYRYILSPHPVIRKETAAKFFKVFKSKSQIEVYENISTTELVSISNLVISGFSSIAYEALFYNVQSIRIMNTKNPQFFDLEDGIMTAKTSKELKKILSKKTSFKSNKKKSSSLKRYFFNKLDNKTYLRFWSFILKQQIV